MVQARVIRRRYVDPLDAIWLAMARGFGLHVERSSEVYASTDGRGTLVLGTDETLDPDDCLAQMIFHEICHACVQAPLGLDRPDWGLDNESARDVVREHACLRLQAALTDAFGLREVLAPTTDFRSFYDALGPDPLALGGTDDARDGGLPDDVVLARAARARMDEPPFAPWVERGLTQTRRVLELVREAERTIPGGETNEADTLEPLHRSMRWPR